MSIRLSSEELKKEHERQRKRGKLIFKTLRKGIISLHNDEDPNIKLNFLYEMENANVRSVTNVVIGDVTCIVECLYDDIEIFKEDGSELTEKLPLWMVYEIEEQIKHKFDMFNIELNFMSQSDILTGKSGKRNLINEGVDDDENQKMIHKAKLIYKALRKGKVEVRYGNQNDYETKIINWTLPNRFKLRVKSHDYHVAQKLGREKYVVLVLDSQTIDIVTNNGKPITNSDNFSMVTKINEQFKKHNIVVYWSGNSSLPDDESTQIDLTPKSK